MQPRVGFEDLVWIVGFGRTGSTWLSLMLSSLPAAAVWFEPNIARALAVGDRPEDAYTNSPLYVFGGLAEHRVPPVRALVLAAVRARYPDHRRGQLLILKDQNSGEHVGRVIEAVPESRVIVLVRDPRDVMASIADVIRAPNGWARPWLEPDARFDVECWAKSYAGAMAAALAAHDAHPGPKVVTTYEALRATPLTELRRVCDALGIPATEEQLATAVHMHAWESVSAADKGAGKFHRKATPGGWRDDLTPEEVAIVERATVPILERFYGAASTPHTAPHAPRRQWPEVDVDPQLSATHALIDQLRATIEQQRVTIEALQRQLGHGHEMHHVQQER